jgi:uncharacterized protein
MRTRDLIYALAGAGTASLLYGALYESKHLILERCTLSLPLWPQEKDGYQIAILADLHLRDSYSLETAQRAVAMALAAKPNMVAILGDVVGYWKPTSEDMIRKAFLPLASLKGRVVCIPGNHEYWLGDPDKMAVLCADLGIQLLRNQVWEQDGVQWVGLDSFTAKQGAPELLKTVRKDPKVVLWHEPDAVDFLPQGAALMLSGHSHGGQYRFPLGLTPMHTKNGRKYPRGFYPDAPTPLYVTRGVGTTGPPSRFLCRPEVSLLTLRSTDQRPA